MTRALTHADVIAIIQAEYRGTPEPPIADRAIVDAFESARGLIRRVCTSKALDREALSFLIRRKTPPAYVGDTVVLAFMADVLDLAGDLEDACRRVGELKNDVAERDRLIADLRAGRAA